MNSKRKPPAKVVSLRDVRSTDVISEDDLKRLADLQAAAWEAERLAHDARRSIETRIRLGASVESGDWYWDVDLKMARSRKERVG